MDGHRSVQDLARLLSDQFPSVPGGLDKSLAFVRKIMKQYG